jgi:DMSO/TMAO reductase YedYZ molybdopterin-dependent catalytic subunit
MFAESIEGEPWRLGAVSTAEWTGIPLIDVLDTAGAKSGQHVIMRGADRGPVAGVAGTVRYERSMSVDDIRESGALLAFAMNGEPLSPRHGYPLRVVVPGWYGMASVKWLTELDVVAASLDAYFQTDRYVYELERDGVTVRQPVERQRVRSLITDPVDGGAVHAGEVTVRGVAWSGAAPVATVEVSVGAGPWQPAALRGEPTRQHWQQWELSVDVAAPGAAMIRARATDAGGDTQPERAESNRLGYGGNAIHTVCVTVR